MLPAVDKSRVSEDAVQHIVELIRSGKFSPGDRLPGERALAHQLQVSRTSVREAIRKLETIGFLETRQGVGTFIKEPSRTVIQNALVPYSLPDAGTLEKVFELREIVEVEAAGRAARRASPAHLEAIGRWLEAMEANYARDDLDGMVRADLGFHRQIIVATGNDVLVNLLDSITDLMLDMRRASLSIPTLLSDTVSGHRAILAAIERGDEQAARQAMLAHLNSVRNKMDLFGRKPDNGQDGR
jgi:GntR family transcriptional repressor for pyruvate dehydrogenase complex